MSFYPCSHCGQRIHGKLASIYSNWFTDSGDREAWRIRLCVGCLTALMGSLKNGSSGDSSGLTVCPMCGSDSSQNLDGIYLTCYVAKQPEREYALTTCVSCAASLRERLQFGADRLGDRNAVAAATAQNASAAWDSVPW